MTKTRKVKQRGGVNMRRRGSQPQAQPQAALLPVPAAPSRFQQARRRLGEGIQWFGNQTRRSLKWIRNQTRKNQTGEPAGNNSPIPNTEVIRLISKWRQNQNKIIEACLVYGKVQSGYFNINIKMAKPYFSLDTNHDFKFFSEQAWERNCFNAISSSNNSNIQNIQNDSNLANNIAIFFGNKAGDIYKTYICLDAVSIDNKDSNLGKFNTPIRWWDGGADSEVMIIVNKPSVNIQKFDILPKDSGCFDKSCQCLFGCFNKCTQCLRFVHSILNDSNGVVETFDNNKEDLDFINNLPTSVGRESSRLKGSLSTSTPGTSASSVGNRDLNWTIQNKFMNIHNFKLPLLHYSPDSNLNFTYDLELNLNNDNQFTLKMCYYNPNKTEKFSNTISLNRKEENNTNPSVNCVSLTQVVNMYKAITECYYNFPKKDSAEIPMVVYATALNSVLDAKNDYWNIKGDISNILNFFYQIINQYDILATGMKNYHTQMLLIFFIFNLKRSGDIGQIEAVKLLQTSFTNKEFVYFTLDSFAATIARQVYDVNVGLLSADKTSYTLCKRTGWGSVEEAPAEAAEAAAIGLSNTIKQRQAEQDFHGSYRG